MSDEILLDLEGGAKAPRSSNKTTTPTLAESLYAQRLATSGDLDSADPATITPGVKTALAEISVQQDYEQVVELSELEASALINQRIGRKSVIDAVTKLLTVSDLIDLINIKETKSYKGAQVIVDGKLLTVSNWSEYCENCEGRSSKTIDLEISNLDALGQSTFEAMRKIGIGPSTMRSIRRLPENDKVLIEQVINTKNKDEIVDLIDGLVSKHQKEKAELTEKTATLEQDLKDSGKRINNMNAEIERSESELSRLKGKQRLTKFEELTEDVRDECMHLQAGVCLNLDSLNKVFADCFYSEPTPEQQLRIEQAYIAIKVSASRAFELLETAQDLLANADIHVDRIQGQHILTPEEAERWLLDSQMLESKHEAEKLSRDVKREAAKPKGRGRPAGSKNKAED